MPSRHIIPANEGASANEDSLDRLRAAIAKGAANGTGTPKHPAVEEGARKQATEEPQGSWTVTSIAERLAHVGVWSVELPALRLTVSEEVLAIHGIPPGSALTVEQSISHYAPDFRDTIIRAFAACASSGTPFDLEVQLITPRGQCVWVRSAGEAVRDAAGVIQRVQGAIQDISERMQAAAEARQQAERLTTTLEGVSLRDIAEAIGRGLNLPLVSIPAEKTGEHFGMFFGHAATQDMPASSEWTRKTLGWEPTGPGMIEDLANMKY